MEIWLLTIGENIQLSLGSELTRNVIDSLQGIVIIIATIFTARWTYRTFAHKERSAELKNLKIEIENYHSQLMMHCSQVREGTEFTDEMMEERLQLGRSHNNILMLNRTGFYNRRRFRKKIQSIVGSWITKNKLDAMMNWNPSKEENQKRWKKFNKEYKKVMRLIDKEASRYI